MAKLSKKLKTQQRNGETTRRITMTGDPFDQISWSIIPAYGEAGPNEVRLFRLDQEIGSVQAVKFGDAIDLVYNKGRDEFRFRKVELPSNDWELILWLFDLPKKYRATTTDAYRSIRDQRLESLIKSNNDELPHWQKEFVIAGGKLMFAQRTPDAEPILLAGLIYPEFAEEALREMIENREIRALIAYEDIAVRLIATERFGWNQDDFNELRF